MLHDYGYTRSVDGDNGWYFCSFCATIVPCVQASQYVTLVAETRAALRKTNPHAQVGAGAATDM